MNQERPIREFIWFKMNRRIRLKSASEECKIEVFLKENQMSIMLVEGKDQLQEILTRGELNHIFISFTTEGLQYLCSAIQSCRNRVCRQVILYDPYCQNIQGDPNVYASCQTLARVWQKAQELKMLQQYSPFTQLKLKQREDEVYDERKWYKRSSEFELGHEKQRRRMNKKLFKPIKQKKHQPDLSNYTDIEVVWIDPSSHSQQHTQQQMEINCHGVRVYSFDEASDGIERIVRNPNILYILIFANSNAMQILHSSYYPFSNVEQYIFFVMKQSASENIIRENSPSGNVFYIVKIYKLVEQLSRITSQYKKALNKN